ncbi:MAG: 1,4-dihydroxy-2-naphthoate octaprenyltransferase [Actinomycetia bacterium]|nr:1,4-dihydroxy-2-naphthoate octaprenyltransferase [Actinomycetes bacterium]
MTLADWWRLARPPTLAATLAPVAVGTAAAALAGPVSPAWTLVMLVVGLLLQIATNMTNEYADYARGVDDRESVGIAGVIVSGRHAPATVRAWAYGTYAAAFVLGLALVAARGLVLLLLGLGAILAGFLYNAGPRPLSATPLGEALVFVVMGPVEVLASEIAAGGRVTAAGAVASVAVGFLVAAILTANNLRDLDQDRARGRRTLVIRLGRTAGFRFLVALVAAGMGWAPLAAALGWLPLPAAAPLLAVPWAWRALERLREPGALRRGVLVVGRIHLVTAFLLGAGLAAAAVV